MSHQTTHHHTAVYVADHDDPEAGMTWFITLASAITLTALVLGLSAMYYGVEEQWTDELVTSAPAENYERSRSEQMSILAVPRRFEQLDVEGNPQARIGIPITTAMEALVADGALAAEGTTR